MKKEIKKLVEEYGKTEQKLLKEINELKNVGADCNCDDREIIKVIHEGNFDEMVAYCLNCGGSVWDRNL